MTLRSALRSEDGFSLIEILIAVTILAAGSVSIMAALGTSVISSGVHRSYSTAETVTRDYTEALITKANNATTYTICPTAAQLDDTTFTGPLNGSGTRLFFTTIEAPPSKWSGDSTIDVQYWIPTGIQTGSFSNKSACDSRVISVCPVALYSGSGSYKPPADCDPGLQRVWIHVKSNASLLPKGLNDAHYVDQYSRILVRRYDAPAPS